MNKPTISDIKKAIKNFPYTVKEQLELDKYNEPIDLKEVQDE